MVRKIKVPKPKPPLEYQIIEATLQFLRLQFPMIKWVAVEPKGSFRFGRPMEPKSVDKESLGVADIIGIWAGPTICLEAKREGEKQRESQIDFEEQVRGVKAFYAVFYTPEQALEWVRGVPMTWGTEYNRLRKIIAILDPNHPELQR